jgi:uncharacterized protein
MEEILASIRRIINDVNDGPANNLDNEPVRQEAVSREQMRPNASPRAEASVGDLAGENLSRDRWTIARPVRPIRSSEEGPSAPADAQPVAGNAASAVAAAGDEGVPEPRPLQGSTRPMLSSVPRPASAEQEIDEIIAQLHSGPHSRLPADEDDVNDGPETGGQVGAPEALPADEFADPGDSDYLNQPQETQEQCEQEPHEEQAEPVHPIAGMQPAPSVPHYAKYEPTPPPLRSKLRDGSRAVVGPGLVSTATSAAVDSAFNTLAQTVLVQNGPTLEDLVRQMLRPMLKTWLDDNLPGLVERLVRAEIERVSRGRG